MLRTYRINYREKVHSIPSKTYSCVNINTSKRALLVGIPDQRVRGEHRVQQVLICHDGIGRMINSVQEL